MHRSRPSKQHIRPRHVIHVDLKHSAWSSDPDHWKEYAPEAYKMLEDGFTEGYFEEYGEALEIVSDPRRDGPILDAKFYPYYDDVRGQVVVEVIVSMYDTWADPYELADSWEIPVERVFDYLDAHGLYSLNGDAGYVEKFEITVPASLTKAQFKKLMAQIDRELENFEIESSDQFRALEDAFQDEED